MNNPKFDDISYNFNILRFLAILSVVAAHSSDLLNNTRESIINANKFLHIFGTFGVPLFFFISGFFYFQPFNRKFMQKKFKSIVIPWFFVESIVWLYIVLRKGGINFFNWLNFIIGNGHSTYYLTVLMILYIVFADNRYNTLKLTLIIFFSILSNYITYSKIVIENYNINPYLNFLNWAIYFSIGLLLNKYNLFDKISCLVSKYVYLFLVFFILFILFQINNNISIYYWSRFALINNISFIFISIGVSRRFKHSSIFVKIGKESFSIYLLHELFVGTIIYLSNFYSSWILVLLRPIIIISIIHLLLKCFYALFYRYEKQRVFKILLGIRQ